MRSSTAWPLVEASSGRPRRWWANQSFILLKLGENFSLFAIFIIPCFSVIILSFINSLLALPFIFLFAVSHIYRYPVFDQIAQKHIESDKRSTMGSTIAFLTSIVAGLSLPFWGKGIDLFGLHNGLFLLGIFTFIIGVIGLLFYKPRRNEF